MNTVHCTDKKLQARSEVYGKANRQRERQAHINDS